MAQKNSKKRKSVSRKPTSIIEATCVPLRLASPVDTTEAATSPLSIDIARIAWDWRNLIVAILRLLAWHRLDFTMQHQQQTNWCWAAVSTSVALFYEPVSTWTQCAVANGELGRNDCCDAGAGGPCNVYGFLGSSLARVGHLDQIVNSSSDFTDVQTEVNAGRPLCARTEWAGGGAHFLAIIGYRVLDEMVAVDDPWYGKSDVSYATFRSSYQGSGSWTDSYFTQP